MLLSRIVSHFTHRTMSVSRRKFVKAASAAVALTAIGSRADALTNAHGIFVPTQPTGAEDFKALARPIVLAPYGAKQTGTWRSPIKTDPFSIPIAEKVALLLAANEAGMKVNNVRFATSGVNFLREEKWFANSEGSYTEQTLYRCSPNVQYTAVAGRDFQTRSGEIPPRGLGYEYLLESDLVGNAPKWADEAAQKLAAKSVDGGRYDLILHPSH